MTAPIYYATEREHLAVESVGDELLIYDRRSDVAHCLGEVAACVWSRCEDGASLDDLVMAVAPFIDVAGADGEPLVLRALGELQEKDLIKTPVVATTVSRRAMLKRAAGVGVAATMVPLVVSATVPKSADAMASPSLAGSCHTTGQGCFAAMTSQSQLNGCCSTAQGAPGYYCDTSRICQACLAKTSSCTIPNQFMCCSGICTGSGKCN